MPDIQINGQSPNRSTHMWSTGISQRSQSVGEDMEQLEIVTHCSWELSECNHFGKVWQFLIKLQDQNQRTLTMNYLKKK